MACPYFLPERPIGTGGWNPAPRLPLGEAWGGSCHASALGRFEPGEDVARELCNYGHARGRCPHFPEGSECDAVRFSETIRETGDAEPARMSFLYVLEQNGAPVRFGEFDSNCADPVLRAQGWAFLESLERMRIR